MVGTPSRWLLPTLALGSALIPLSLTPVVTALPSINGALGSGLDGAGWIMTAYLLVLTACLLPAGRLGDRIGFGPVFRAGALVYVAGSLVCAAAPGLAWLVAGRAVQGLGTALLSACGFAVVSLAFPPTRRGRTVAAVTMAASIGSLGGILASAAFLQWLNWRFVFVAVIPFALACAWGAVSIPRNRPTQPAPLDLPGMVLFAATLALFSLSLGHYHDGEESFAGGWRYHLGLHAATLAGGLIFVLVERRAVAPLVELAHFRHGRFARSVAANLILHMVMMGVVFLVPFAVQNGLALTPRHTAGLLLAMEIASASFAPLAGWLHDRFSGLPVRPVAKAIIAVGLAAFGFATGLPYAAWLAIAAGTGIGMGLFWTTNNAAIMASLDDGLRGFASGMLESSRQLGHALATSLALPLLFAGTGSRAALLADPQLLLSSVARTWWAFAALAAIGAVLVAADSILPAPRATPGTARVAASGFGVDGG